MLIDREVGRVQAVDDVSLTLHEGETLGLVGESGCGKSTLCRAILQLIRPTSGSVRFEGEELVGRSRKQLRPLRRQMQMIFQDPFASLNPRKRVGQIVGDPLKLHGLASGGELKRRVQELLERVGLSGEHYNRFPHEFSGGQRQRIGIARALALQPKLIIADEPVSALWTSRSRRRSSTCSRTCRTSSGSRTSSSPTTSGWSATSPIGSPSCTSERSSRPLLPRSSTSGRSTPTRTALLSAVPIPDPEANREREPLVLEGDVPSPVDPPPACRFHTRCPWATEICSEVEPPLVSYGSGQAAACHHPLNLKRGMLSKATITAESPASAGDVLPEKGGAARVPARA